MSETMNNNFESQVPKTESISQTPEDFAAQIKAGKALATKMEASDPDGKYDNTKLASMFDSDFANISYNPENKTAGLREDLYKKVRNSLRSDPIRNIAASYEKRGLGDGEREKRISGVFRGEKPIKTASI